MKEDIKKEYKELFDATTKAPDIVTVPKFKSIMIDGVGNPRTEEFKEMNRVAEFSIRRHLGHLR